MRDCGLGKARGGEEVELEEAGPFFIGLVPARLAGASTEVGDEVVEAAEVGGGALEGACDGGGVGEVAADGEDAILGVGRGEFGGSGFEGCFITTSEDDAGTFREECGRDGFADAARAAGDEGDLIGELEVQERECRG